MTTQQGQTRAYFNEAARYWQAQSENATGVYSVIDGRNRAVLDVAGQFPSNGRFLDVGCGTGQLAISVAGLGWRAEGIDFATDMVVQCKANAQAANSAATFTEASFFDAEFEDGAYDLISAQGFLEYVSTTQADEFFHRVNRMLRPGGALALGSRNRLFNVFSLNDFTRQEIEMGTLGMLMAEALALQSSATTDDALREMRRLGRVDPQPDHHPLTGIPVDTRYQFSPAELAYRLGRVGLAAHAVYPVHFHALPPSIKAEQPQLHSVIAHEAARIGLRDHRLVPMSSTFVLDVRKV